MMRSVKNLSLVLLLLLTGSCFAGYVSGVKLINQNKYLIVNKKFYLGSDVCRNWSVHDRYEIDGDKLLNTTRKQFIPLKPTPTVKVIKVFKRDKLLTDEYIILLQTHKFYFVRSHEEIKTGHSEEFLQDGKLLFDIDGNEFELKELNSWESLY